MRVLGASIAVTLLLVSSAHAQTQLATNESACAAFSQADKALNSTYQQVLARYKSDPVFIAKLKTTQRAWLKYRDAQLDMRYPDFTTSPQALSNYGTALPMCLCTVQADMTQARVAQLRLWLNGQEGDVCNGSIRVGK